MAHRRASRILTVAVSVSLSALVVSTSRGQNWNGSASGSWSVASNWQGNVAPVSSTDTLLNFTGVDSYAATNDIADPFTLNQLNFSNTGALVTLNGGALLFNGSLQQINQLGTSAVIISNPIQIHSTGSNTDALTIGGSGVGTVAINGAISSTSAPTDTGGAAINLTNPAAMLKLSGGENLFSIRSSAGSLVLNGGSWSLTSQQHRNDIILLENDGPWGLSVGEVSNQTTNFTMNGGSMTAPSAFISVANSSRSTGTFTNGAICDFSGDNGRFGINAGDGTINILNGAQITCRLADFGRQLDFDRSTGPNALVNVAGANSRLVCTDYLSLVRGYGTGTINIANGGAISVAGDADLAVGALDGGVSDEAPVYSSVTVTGNGSRFDVGGQMLLGSEYGGNTTLTIGAGAAVTSGDAFVGGPDFGAGTLLLEGGSYTCHGKLSVTGQVLFNAGTLKVDNQLDVGGSVMLSEAGRSTNGTATNKKLLEAGSMTFTSSGFVDLNDNDAIVHNNALSDVEGFIRTGRNGGTWDGNQLVSTAAKNNANKTTTLAAITGGQFHSVAGASALFDSHDVSNTDVLIKYTYFGDANFNGKVDGGDYARIDTSFNNELTGGNITGWFNGDFDYNGKVDGADYALIDLAFNEQNATVLAKPIEALHVNSPNHSVPEPSAIALGTSLLFIARRTNRGQHHTQNIGL